MEDGDELQEASDARAVSKFGREGAKLTLKRERSCELWAAKLRGRASGLLDCCSRVVRSGGGLGGASDDGPAG